VDGGPHYVAVPPSPGQHGPPPPKHRRVVGPEEPPLGMIGPQRPPHAPRIDSAAVSFPEKQIRLRDPPADDSVVLEKAVDFLIPGLREKLLTVLKSHGADLSKLDGKDRSVHSETKEVGGFMFRILAHLVGVGEGASGHFSLFLERQPQAEEGLPGKSRMVYTQFCIIARSNSDPQWNASNCSNKAFGRYGDLNWGFAKFMEHKLLLHPPAAFFSEPSGDLLVTVDFRFCEGWSYDLWGADSCYDSKAATDMVGIANQGATCYMNSLLQTLYFTGKLRDGVFKMPTISDDFGSEESEEAAAGAGPIVEAVESQQAVADVEDASSSSSKSPPPPLAVGQHPRNGNMDVHHLAPEHDSRPATVSPLPGDKETESNVALAIQRVFYRLQTSDVEVETKELTKSFGWTTIDAFRQHDVQEFLRVLMDNIEEKMKGTPVEGLIADLFMGTMKSYITCTNVDYESSRQEDFYDIQLKVKGIPDLVSSFKDYTEVEMLEGENKYAAEGHGLQDAKKGIIFTKLPKVLHLQLRRFEYDMDLDESVKVNDRFEFPEHVDLSDFVDDSAEEAKASAQYSLHAVLVQGGNVHGGHYVAYIKPDHGHGAEWFKFDDDRVTRCTATEAIDGNFGEAPADGGLHRSSTSAYMLVYVKDDEAESVMLPIPKTPVPAHLERFFAEEVKVIATREKELRESHMMMDVGIFSTTHYIGFDGPGLPDLVSTACMLKLRFSDGVTDLYLRAASVLGCKAHEIILRPFVNRQNSTYRPDEPIPSDQLPTNDAGERMTLQALVFQNMLSKRRTMAPLVAMQASDTVPFQDPERDQEILLFIKRFDPDTSFTKDGQVVHVPASLTLRSMLQIDKRHTIQDLYPALRQVCGFPAGADLVCFEEVTTEYVDKGQALLERTQTLGRAEIQDGDIIICTEARVTPLVHLEELVQYFDVRWHHLDVHFRDALSPADAARHFQLPLDNRMRYDYVAGQVGKYIGHDASKVALYPPDALEGPLWHARYRHDASLHQMVKRHGGHETFHNMPVFFYQCMRESIETLDQMIFLSDVHVMDLETLTPYPTRVYVHPHATLDDVIATILADFPTQPQNPAEYRLLKMMASGYEIDSIADSSDTAEMLEHLSLRLERIPLEQRGVNYKLPPGAGLAIEVGTPLLVQVGHYYRTTSNLHSIPFLILVRQGEKLASVEARIKEILDVNDDDWEKYQCGIKSRFDSVMLLSEKAEGSHDLPLREAPVDIAKIDRDGFKVLLEHRSNRRRPKRTFDGAVKILN